MARAGEVTKLGLLAKNQEKKIENCCNGEICYVKDVPERMDVGVDEQFQWRRKKL